MTEEQDLDKGPDVLGTKSQSLTQFRERKTRLNHVSYQRLPEEDLVSIF